MTTATANPINPALNPPWHPGWVLGIGAAASLMVALDAMIISTAMPAIGAEFSGTVETLQWTLNGYALSFAVLLMTASAIADRYGRRAVFMTGVLVFAASSAACALSPSLPALIAARAAQGAGSAMMLPSALALIGAAFPPERRAWALGIFSAVTGLSTILGPALGGVMTQSVGWRWVFWINVPIGVAIIALAAARMAESRGNKVPLDLAGAALITLAACGIEWGLVRAAEAGWQSGEVLFAIAGGLVFAVVFALWQARARHPMIPLTLFRSADFSGGVVTIFLGMAVLMAAIFFSAQYVQAGLGFGPRDAGLAVLPWGLAVTVFAPFSGRIAKKFGERGTVVVAMLAQAVGLGAMAAAIMTGGGYVGLIVPMIVAGAAFAITVPVVQKVVMGAVAVSDLGKASGTLSMARQLGGAFGLAVAVSAFAFWRGDGAAPAPAGFIAAFAVATVMSAIGALTALSLRGAKAKPAMAAVLQSGESKRA